MSGFALGIWSASAKELREKAAQYDARANAAERDGDYADAAKWTLHARDLRRHAREKEFAA